MSIKNSIDQPGGYPMDDINMDTASTPLKTRARILQCAVELIKKDGYKQVTIPNICNAAGITKSTFYYHYHSKEELIGDFIDQLGNIVKNSHSHILLEETYLKQIWAVFHILLQGNIAAGPAIIKQVFISQLNTENHYNFPRSAVSWDIVVKLLERAQTARQIENQQSPAKIAEAAFELLRGVLVTWAIENGTFDLEDASKKILAILLLPAEGYDL
jgi:AcrR family transcriptional regulator